MNNKTNMNDRYKLTVFFNRSFFIISNYKIIKNNASAVAFRAGVHCPFHEALPVNVPTSRSTSITPTESNRLVCALHEQCTHNRKH